MSNKKDVLVIEDDVSMATTISHVLESSLSYKSHIAVGGSEGIQKAFTLIPDMILCDIRMKDIDGYRVLMILRESSITDTIPFIFISGKSEAEDIKLGMKLGVDDYITKPFHNKDLIHAVKNRMEKYDRIIERTYHNFQTLLNFSQIPLFTHSEEKFLHVNKAMTTLTGFSADELAERSIYDIIVQEQSESLASDIESCLRNVDSLTRQELTIIDKTGQYQEVSVQCRAGRYINGRPMLIASMTEKRKKRSFTLAEIEENIESIAENLHVSENISSSLIRELRGLYKGTTDEKVRMNGFSTREKEVLRLTCKGFAIKQIAEELNISARTVEKHRTSLMQKTGSGNVVEVIIYAIKNDLIDI